MSSSASPIRRNRCPSTVPSSTIETLLMAVPVSGGRRGTAPGSGHSTRKAMLSSAIVSPVASPSVRRSCASSHDANARYPGPGPSMPGSRTRPTR